jgi:hypothetical protein
MLQKRTISTLSTFLMDESSEELLQRNVLKLLLNLLPICPKRDDDQKQILQVLDAVLARPNNTESVLMMLGSAKRNICRLRGDAKGPSNDNGDVAEDGEVRCSALLCPCCCAPHCLLDACGPVDLLAACACCCWWLVSSFYHAMSTCRRSGLFCVRPRCVQQGNDRSKCHVCMHLLHGEQIMNAGA